MKKISEQLKGTLESRPVKDHEKLKKQQGYYHRLKKDGVAQKQSYNLKSISAI